MFCMSKMVAYSRVRRHRRRRMWIPWVVFSLVSLILLALMWFGWQVMNGRPIIPSSIDSFMPIDGKTVTIGLRTAPKSLDIRNDNSDELQQALLENVYETLVNRDENNELKPGLAKSWNVSSDGLKYTFNLRHGVTFSNGVVLDSKAVLQSLKQGITSRYPGYEALENVKLIDNTDAYTLKIELNSPDPLLLRRLAGRAGIVYDTGALINYSNNALGSGPFVVSSYKKDDSLVLRCNNKYWGTRAKLGGIILKYFKDDASLTNAMSSGSIQMAIPLDGADNNRLATLPQVSLVKGKSTRVQIVAFNNDIHSVFNENWIRIAASYAIDSKWAIDADANGGVQVGGPIDPLSPGYEDLTNVLPFDKVQARKHFSYFYPRYYRTMVLLVPKNKVDLGKKIADAVSSGARAKVDLQILDQSEIENRIRDHKYDMALSSINHTLDIDTFVRIDSPYLFQKHDSQEAYSNAISSPNVVGYLANIKKYARNLSENAPIKWLYAKNSVLAVKSNIEGYPKNMTDQLLPLRDLNEK